MIIARNFVAINYPKTGTTFFRSAVKRVLEDAESLHLRMLVRLRLIQPAFRELMLPKLYGDYGRSYVDQHGVYRQIPADHASKTIVSIVRNPLSRYISGYLFGWWKSHPPFAKESVIVDFPNFPNLSFHEFYQLLNHPLVNEDRIPLAEARKLGNYTRMFLVFYTPDPSDSAARVLRGEPLASILPAITFLHQENLQSELVNFLQLMSYSRKNTLCIEDIGRLNASRDESKTSISRKDMQKVAQSVLQDEKALLDLFPEYRKAIDKVSCGLALDEISAEERYALKHVGRQKSGL